MSKTAASLSVAIALLILVFAAQPSRANITELGELRVDITHPFIIGNTTLPAGHYDFHMLQGADQRVMIATNSNGDTSIEVLVRRSKDSHIPQHTEFVVDRYGKKEILKEIYQANSQNGVALIESSRIEQRLQKQGQKADRHTEGETQ